MMSMNEKATVISSEEEEEKACLFAMQLASGSVLPMVLKSAIELDLLEFIQKASSGSASASELASQLPTNNPDAATMIDRILRLLAAHSIVVCSLKTLPDGGGVERRYSPAPVCKFLTKNNDGVSIAPMSIMIQDRVLMESWYHLKDAIIEGGIPFNKAYGTSAFEYAGTDSRFNNIFNQAMSQHSTILMNKILKDYKGFEGLKSLVDVGGGIGTSLNLIISQYPSIKGFNFDLPHVIRDAPSYPGIEHIGGDMFVSVPKADAIFMKWICHDWSDAHCLKLLKNCYEALPNYGKIILAELILSEDPNTGLDFQTGAGIDVLMLAFNPGGKERTENEFQALIKQAGFKKFQRAFCAYNMWLIEISK